MSAGVLVGYDGSDCAKAALAAGIEVAKAYGDKLTIAFGYEVNPVGGEVQDYAKALQELAAKRLQEAGQLTSGVEFELVTVERAPAAGLAELASKNDVRVIVVGTRGESPLHAALLGSTPHKLLALADRPVLVVPG
jgi:nucleotide-binding universal stress UspA family protein